MIGVSLEVYDLGDGHGIRYNTLTDCPLCGYEFDLNGTRWPYFLNEHGPGDCAGVTPLGERPDNADRPLFPDEGEPEGSL